MPTLYTDILESLKLTYEDGEPADIAMREKVFLKDLRKEDDFGGEGKVLNVFYDVSPGRSAALATAQANAGHAKRIKFTIDKVAHDYGVIRLDDEMVARARNNKYAMVVEKTKETDSNLEAHGKILAHSVYREGWGSVGVATTITSDVITLGDPYTAWNFVVGAKYQLADEEDGGTPRNSGATFTVESVDYDAGTVTATGAVTGTIGAAANGDYIFPQDDTDEAGTTQTKIRGLAAWNPRTAPGGSDDFWGANRSVKSSLSGFRFDASSTAIEEVPIKLCNRMKIHGGKVGAESKAYIHPIKLEEIILGLGAKVVYDTTGGEATVGMTSIVMAYSGGRIKLVGDPDCVSDEVRVVNLKHTWLTTMFEVPHVVMTDGLGNLRMSADDATELRTRYWAQMCCDDPSGLGVAYNL